MASNDQIILDQVLEQQKNDRAPSASKSDFFETYVAEQLLKDYDLSDDEIESGLVGNGGDGGIDGIYVFANGELVRDDFDTGFLKKNVSLEVWIFQSKRSASFDEDTLNRFVATTNDLFDLNRELDQFHSVYNDGLRSAVFGFRNIFEDLAARFPNLSFKYIYATRGDSTEVHPNVTRKVKSLNDAVSRLFSAASFSFSFVGASDLLQLARRAPITSFELNVVESISAQGGYIALVKLKEFDRFITDDKNQLRKNIFEANVRDYQGVTTVNDEIQKTLAAKQNEDFWWLNNGVTIIAAKAVQSGKTLTLEDPQIVNGLQSSTEIHKYFRTSNTSDEIRSVMVRVVVPAYPESSDRIIKATNSQTSIPSASLRATDKIHRDIEDYLQNFGLYYDRRKNRHKNEGRSIERIVSIPLMAQSIMSVAMQRPNDARARPSSLISKDDDYEKIFGLEHPIELYLNAAQLIKRVQSVLKSNVNLLPKDKSNLLFYVAMYVASTVIGVAEPNIADIAKINRDQISDELINSSLQKVKEEYDRLGGSDQVAKGTQLLARLKESLNQAGSSACATRVTGD